LLTDRGEAADAGLIPHRLWASGDQEKSPFSELVALIVRANGSSSKASCRPSTALAIKLLGGRLAARSAIGGSGSAAHREPDRAGDG